MARNTFGSPRKKALQWFCVISVARDFKLSRGIIENVWPRTEVLGRSESGSGFKLFVIRVQMRPGGLNLVSRAGFGQLVVTSPHGLGSGFPGRSLPWVVPWAGEAYLSLLRRRLVRCSWCGVFEWTATSHLVP